MAYTLPPINVLSSSPHQIQEILDHLFEPSPSLYSLVASQLPREFSDWDAFCDWVGGLLLQLLNNANANNYNDELLLEILGAHPRLGAAKVDSAHSQAEQRSLASGDEEEGAKLQRLNEEYEKTFPGMKSHYYFSGEERRVGAKVIQECDTCMSRASSSSPHSASRLRMKPKRSLTPQKKKKKKKKKQRRTLQADGVKQKKRFFRWS
jgi:2-oxo-4-hydroxy-4-carboxy--5-ureidoimidazoline (OHCU) decarboxylase